MDEVSGRDTNDIDVLFEGEPQTPQQKLAVGKAQAALRGDGLRPGQQLRPTAPRSTTRWRCSSSPSRRSRTRPRRAARRPSTTHWEVNQGVKNVDAEVEEHRRAVDAVADRWAMIAAIVAGVAVTALTFGAAGPVIAGALGALAAAEATIITKLAVKGSAYSNEEILVDVVSGAVDVVFAVLTAGVGNALDAGVQGHPDRPAGQARHECVAVQADGRPRARQRRRGVPERHPVRLPPAPSPTRRHGPRGTRSRTSSSATGMGALTGTFMGGVMGSTGGLSKAAAHGPHLDPGRPPDLDAAAKAFDEARAAPPHVDPEVRAGQWHAHQAKHPGATYARLPRRPRSRPGRARPGCRARVPSAPPAISSAPGSAQPTAS